MPAGRQRRVPGGACPSNYCTDADETQMSPQQDADKAWSRAEDATWVGALGESESGWVGADIGRTCMAAAEGKESKSSLANCSPS